jgi:hypothetical protein
MILGESQPFASPGEALEHYGTKGMKWGVRNEQDSKNQSGKAGVDPVTAAIGAVYVATFLATTYVTIRDMRRMKNDGGEKTQEMNANVPWKKKPELSKKMSVEQLESKVVKQVNPEYPKAGTKMNCRRATFTYEMRRRGYDVTATKSHFATGQDIQGLKATTMNSNKQHYQSTWGQSQVSPPKTYTRLPPEQKSKMIFDALGKQPEGARGELTLGWKMGGGHSMAYEVVKGKPIVFDTQNSKTYRNSTSLNKYAQVANEAAYTRTDNVDLDERFLRRWMVNA